MPEITKRPTSTFAPGGALAGYQEVVLVVDDSEANRYAVGQMLRRAGFGVIEVGSGEAGIERAMEGADLIILDVHLPDLDGYEVVRRLKTDVRTAHIPVLHLSAVRRDVTDRVQGLEAGADAYLTHPVEPNELVAMSKALLRLRRVEHELVRQRGEAMRLHEQAQDAQARAEEAHRQAEDASRAKSDFLAVMSHELRTPLNAIGGYAEMLAMGIHGPVTAAQREAIVRIQAAQRHLSSLINDVLDHARIETRRVQYAIADVTLHDALVELDALVAPQMAARELEYVYIPCDPQLVARADRERVTQIVVNLVANAIKFTPRGGRITLDCAADDAQHVTLRVRDTGPGIPADQLQSIFEPFVQLDQPRSAPNDGVGLGLAISRDLARGMGGELTVESRVGEGATFILRLPRA